MTKMWSNGTKFAGQAPDSIETLFNLMRFEPLDRRLGRYGFVRQLGDGVWRISGNFHRVSHVFCIDTDDAALTAKLRTAIRSNIQRADYRAQA